MASLTSRPDRLTVAAFLTIVVLLGMNFVFVRFSNRELDPLWGAAIRFAIAAVLLATIAAARGARAPRGRQLRGTVLYGTLAFALSYGLLYWGMLEVTAGLAGVLVATIPLATLFLAVAAGLERFSWRGLAGALVVVAGLAVIFAGGLGGEISLVAVLAVLAGAVAAAGANIVVKRTPGVHPLAMNAVGMAVGASLLSVGALLASETPALPTASTTWLALGWLVMSSMTGFALIVWVLGRWTASAVSYVTVLMPLVAIGSGAIMAGEPIGPGVVAGAGLVIAGVYVGALSGRPTVPAPAAAAPAAAEVPADRAGSPPRG